MNPDTISDINAAIGRSISHAASTTRTIADQLAEVKADIAYLRAANVDLIAQRDALWSRLGIVDGEEPEKPSDQTASRWGNWLLEEAAKPDFTLTLLYAQAVGAFSLCDTLEQFAGVKANLKRAEQILTSR